ncbi:MAG: Clp protease N-terminal domain-containing protein [Terriglobia bacterium]
MFGDFSPRAGRVLFLARRAAGQRGGSAIEIEDLLAALIVEDQGWFLARRPYPHGVFPDPGAQVDPWPHPPLLYPALANDLLSRLEALGTRFPPVPDGSEMRLSADVSHVFSVAGGLKDELGHSEVRPLHLLAAALRENDSRAPDILKRAGITSEKVVEALRGEGSSEPGWRLPPGHGPVGFDVGPELCNERVRFVLFSARLQARARGAATVEIGDVLAGLVIEDQRQALDEFPEIHQYPNLVARLQVASHPPFFSPDMAARMLARLEAVCSRSQPLAPGSSISLSREVKHMLVASSQLAYDLAQDEVQRLHLLAAIALSTARALFVASVYS